ncbi:MAG: PEP-CTERM sorting domain-containing protein [Terracidiphilus sp.]
MKNFLIATFASASFLIASMAARADTYTLVLDAPIQDGGPDFLFSGTFTNESLSTVYLNADSFSLDAGLALDDSSYLTNFPLSVGSWDSAWGELFIVTAPLDEPSSSYTGSFSIVGGVDENAQDVLATADFDVKATPEPSSLLLLGSGLLAFIVLLRGPLRDSMSV